MYKKTLLTLATTALVACGSDDNNDKKSNITLNEDSFVVQTTAADYGSSQLAIGKVSGDRTAYSALSKSRSDFSINTYKNVLYHIGRFTIDEVSRYEFNTGKNNLSAVYTYSTNDDRADKSNPYSIIQTSDDVAYVIRYGMTSIIKVNPKASSPKKFVTGKIDLSAYTYPGAPSPRMAAAVVENNKLFVGMQRLNKGWAPQQAYVAVIDLTNDTEIDTNTTDGADALKGIPVAAENIESMTAHNGTVYVAGRGNHASKYALDRVITSGALVSINASDYSATTLIDGTTYSDLNDISKGDNNTYNDTYYHITDVAVSNAGVVYTLINLENSGKSNTRLVQINNGQRSFVSEAAIANKEIRDINVGPQGHLWLAIANADKPGIVVLDTASNSQHGDFINTDLPARQIEFLTIQ